MATKKDTTVRVGKGQPVHAHGMRDLIGLSADIRQGAAPEPIEIAITGRGALRERAGSGGAKAAAAAVAPRAGAWRRTR